MQTPIRTNARLSLLRPLLISGVLLLACSNSASAWWNKEWTIRKKITIDTTAKGTDISDPIGGTAVLLRLPEGVFQFAAAKEDGSDIRFVAGDEKTELAFHLERFDPLMGEAFAWVRLPEVKAGAQTSFWLYYGDTRNTQASGDTKATYDADTVLVYHFSEHGAPPVDLTKNGNNAQNAGTAVDGAMIAGGVRLGGAPVVIPASPSLAWNEGANLTISAWVKPVTLTPGAVVLSRQEGASAFALGLDNGVPFVQVNGERSGNGAPVAANSWHHLAVVCAGSKVTLLLDGDEYGSLNATTPALNSPILLGGENDTAFAGEMDELEISKVARSLGFIRFAAYSQGSEKAAKLLSLAQDEQKRGWLSGTGTFAVLVGSLTPDGWVVIGILAIMAVISWGVMISKTRYLNAVTKGNDEFFRQWHHVATDLTVLDRGDVESAKSMGGRVHSGRDYLIKQGSVYRIYHIGVEEIQHRFANPDVPPNAPKILSAQSIEAIRASLDGGLVQEQQRLNNMMVLLTIAISGGPFLGLLGTVVGVMITFAAIAAAGDVNVNAIAPGIAAALLATVAGLAVAIPSLFGYNYLITRIKNATSDMHVFIDEFVAKIAEFYRPRNDNYRPRDVGYFDPRASADVGA